MEGKKKKGNISNLCPPWKKGESGNPNGRPKNRALEDRVRVMGEKKAKCFYGLTTQEIRTWQETLVSCTAEQLNAFSVDKDIPVYAATYAKALLSDLSDGKTTTADRLIDKLSMNDRIDIQSMPDRKRVLSKKRYYIRVLKEQNKYSPELSVQVEAMCVTLVRLEMLHERMEADGYSPVNVEVSREGNRRESISKTEQLLMEYSRQLQSQLKNLGMTYNFKDKNEDTPLSGLLEAMREES